MPVFPSSAPLHYRLIRWESACELLDSRYTLGKSNLIYRPHIFMSFYQLLSIRSKISPCIDHYGQLPSSCPTSYTRATKEVYKTWKTNLLYLLLVITSLFHLLLHVIVSPKFVFQMLKTSKVPTQAICTRQNRSHS